METPAQNIELFPGSAGDLSGEAQSLSAPSPWDLAALAGRLVEITSPGPGRLPLAQSPSQKVNIWDIAAPRDSGGAALTCAAGLVWKAQQLGEPTAWISARTSTFYPPDLDAGGIDLAALVVVRAASASLAARAADKLLRSGAFGLLVLDLAPGAVVPSPLLSRLLGLARKHSAVVVFLTEKARDSASLGSIVSLQVTTSRRRSSGERFPCTIEAVKDKRQAPGWKVEEMFRGPPGLR